MSTVPNPHYEEVPYRESTWDPENGFVTWKEDARIGTEDEVTIFLEGSNGKKRELKLNRKFDPINYQR